MRPVPPAATQPPPANRRVREQAREVAALMAFSAFTSIALAVGLLLITSLGSRG